MLDLFFKSMFLFLCHETMRVGFWGFYFFVLLSLFHVVNVMFGVLLHGLLDS